MKQFGILSLFLFVCHSVSYACINYYSLDIHGDFHMHGGNMQLLIHKNFDPVKIEERLDFFYQEYLKTENTLILSDYAVTLLKGGRVEEGLEILKHLSVEYPNEYKIASNLGTAYELNGQVDSALVYIKKGMSINPKAHGGSEWVHVKVLETKLALAENPDYLTTNTVLGLGAKKKSLQGVRRHIETQVMERCPFTPASDPIMASILVDLGDCYMNYSVSYAKFLYEIADVYYDYIDKNTLHQKRKQAEVLLTNNQDELEDRNEKAKGYNRGLPNSYEEILKDNNPENKTIDWSKYELNLDKLLNASNKATTVENPNTIVAGDAEESKESNGNLFLILVGAVGGFLLIGLLLRFANRN